MSGPLVNSWWLPVDTVATRVHTVAQWHTDTGYWHYWHHQNYSPQIASSPNPALPLSSSPHPALHSSSWSLEHLEHFHCVQIWEKKTLSWLFFVLQSFIIKWQIIGEQMLNPVFILPLIKANWVFCSQFWDLCSRSWFLYAFLPLLESPVNSHQTSIRILYQMLCSWNVYVVQGNMTQPLHWKYKRKGELSFTASLSNIR